MIFKQRRNSIIAEARVVAFFMMILRNVSGALLYLIQAARRADPEHAVAVFKRGGHETAAQAVLRRL